MLSKKIALAVVAGTALLAASGASAQDRYARHGYGWYAGHHHRHAPRPVVVVGPAPYDYYGPAPVYYTPPPVAVYRRPPPRVVYAPAPVYRYDPDWRLSIGVRF